MLYLLDANVLIDANRDYYPITRVPEFWEWLLHVTEQALVKMPAEICHEILKGDDDLKHWLNNHKMKIQLNENVQPELVRYATINGYGDSLDDVEIEKVGRDPFLLAHCLADRENRCTVTTEVSKPKKIRANRHIPDVCRDLRIKCCDTFELLRSLNFSTSWNR